MRVLLVFLFLLIGFSQSAFAESDVCKNNDKGIDVCEFAKNQQEDAAPNMPQRVSKNLIIKSVIANKNVLTFGAMLSYSREYLENAAKQGGKSMQVLEKQMNDMTQNLACSIPGMDEFINLGGEVELLYTFNTGHVYLLINVSSC